MQHATDSTRRANIILRPATPDDVPLLLDLIRELAEYEKLSHQVSATKEGLTDSLFGPKAAAEAVLATFDHQPAGFAVFFHNFSTFLSRRGLYLEDLYVRPAFRRCGIGKALLTHLARLAVERGCGRFEWSVLDWNELAQDFYRQLGADVMPDWRICRITGEELRRLAAS